MNNDTNTNKVNGFIVIMHPERQAQLVTCDGVNVDELSNAVGGYLEPFFVKSLPGAAIGLCDAEAECKGLPLNFSATLIYHDKPSAIAGPVVFCACRFKHGESRFAPLTKDEADAIMDYLNDQRGEQA